jgi:hypothetical protein
MSDKRCKSIQEYLRRHLLGEKALAVIAEYDAHCILVDNYLKALPEGTFDESLILEEIDKLILKEKEPNTAKKDS